MKEEPMSKDFIDFLIKQNGKPFSEHFINNVIEGKETDFNAFKTREEFDASVKEMKDFLENNGGVVDFELHPTNVDDHFVIGEVTIIMKDASDKARIEKLVKKHYKRGSRVNIKGLKEQMAKTLNVDVDIIEFYTDDELDSM